MTSDNNNIDDNRNISGTDVIIIATINAINMTVKYKQNCYLSIFRTM